MGEYGQNNPFRYLFITQYTPDRWTRYLDENIYNKNVGKLRP